MRMPPSKARKNLHGMEIIGSIKFPQERKNPDMSVEILPVVQLAAQAVKRRRYESIMQEIL